MILEKVLQRVLNITPRFFKHSYTLILIIFSRAIFYYVDFEKLKIFIKTLFHSEFPVSINLKNDLLGYLFYFIVVVLLCIPWDEIFNAEHKLHKRASRLYFYFAPAINILFLLLGTVLLIDDTYNPFIYFRF